MENREEFTSEDPLKYPGAKTSLFSGPRGSQVAGTSRWIINEVRPLPPIPVKAGVTSSAVISLLTILTLMIFIPPPFLFMIFSRTGK
jgi:hypothetical protein